MPYEKWIKRGQRAGLVHSESIDDIAFQHFLLPAFLQSVFGQNGIMAEWSVKEGNSKDSLRIPLNKKAFAFCRPGLCYSDEDPAGFAGDSVEEKLWEL